MSDDELLQAYLRGKEIAFDLLFERYKQPLYNYFYRNCDSTVVDELFQDVWLRVIASARRYQNQNRFRSWLFTLAHNCLVDFYRRQGARVNINVKDESAEERELADGLSGSIAGSHDQQKIASIIDGKRLEDRLKEALACLPADQREAFYLREESGFSIRDIAKIQEISSEAAKSRLRYAYKKLRDLLEEAPI
ncbi:MAG: RNA polymerase sigma factor (sigma-70 family) [Candidatus Azotimanducaceae bacterium]|jgi:RNA polymerase sigma factor (sigma-70 family)